MAAGKKAVVVALAAVVGIVPVFAQMGAVQPAQEAQPCLPIGQECSDDELLTVEGEIAWYLVALLDAGIAAGSAIGIYKIGGLDISEGAKIAAIGGVAGAAALIVIGIDRYLLSDR
ncbi:hypothetical protein H5T53_05465 [Candidatus Bipolaricaulota bacterium]|nr:hypothetical protein [Candidatus Bipolaricaulota bacterium]